MEKTLSNLVQLKDTLQRYLDVAALKTTLQTMQQNVKSMPEYSYYDHISVLMNGCSEAFDKLSAVEHDMELVIDDINSDINDLMRHQFVADYSKKMISTVDQIRNGHRTKLEINDEIYKTLLGRIQMYADWHYPGMQIGPQDGYLTDHMVSCDPLYLVDVFPEFLESTLNTFNEIYRARVRPYTIGYDGVKTKSFSELPQNQFGFVLCWEVFNFLALDSIKEYLTELYDVLRPGGTILFSYNDGDTVNGSKNAEWGGCTFVPKRLLVPLVNSLGYDVSASFNFQPGISDVSWLEIKKPGEKSTIKGHQVLGIIQDLSKQA